MLLTARAEQQDRLRAFTLGVSDYLTKPFAESELLAVARQLLLRGSEAKEAAGEEGPDEALMSHAEWLAEIQGHALAALAKGWLTVGYVADQMGMSERQLQRRLKTATGLSPKAYLQEIQMQYAREQLEEGKVDQVGKLAASIGFKNAHYFSQKYEERFGKRPIDYLQA
jgi:transcriptional regulator GlxA family with amidase domain